MKAGTRPSSCPTCGGRGQVRQSQGFFTLSRTCSRCGGAGEVIAAPCEACRGTGRAPQKRTLTVRIPAGIENGTRLRVQGEGEAGEKGAPRGDLYVAVRVKPHPFFEREGANLACEVDISFAQAALGITVEIATLGGGRETLKIPPGTQSGAVFKVRGRGLRDLDTRRMGDLYVKVQVRIPDDLTKEEKALLRQFAHLRGESLDRLDVASASKRRTAVH
jgi:molecular chaperone DnaJ